MNMAELKSRAAKEPRDIFKYIKYLLQCQKSSPKGIDVSVPSWAADQIISYCDNHNIPAYLIDYDCISTAGTYSLLLAYENLR